MSSCILKNQPHPPPLNLFLQITYFKWCPSCSVLCQAVEIINQAGKKYIINLIFIFIAITCHSYSVFSIASQILTMQSKLNKNLLSQLPITRHYKFHQSHQLNWCTILRTEVKIMLRTYDVMLKILFVVVAILGLLY